MENSENNGMTVSSAAPPAAVSDSDTLIKLPGSAGVDTNSAEFCEIAVAVLPEDIKLEVKELARNQKIKYSRFEIVLCLLVIAVICWIAGKFFTPPPPVYFEINTHEIPIAGQKLDTASPEGRLLRKMNDLFKSKDYDGCLKLLPQKKLDEFIADKKLLMANSEAVNIYLTALHLVNAPEQKADHIAAGSELCRKLINTAPDVPAWHLHLLRFDNYAIITQDSFKKIPLSRRNGRELARLEQQIAKLKNIETYRWNQEEATLFDLWQCKIYIACWLHYLAYDDTHTVSDNNNGVREREKAYELAGKYGEENLDFLDLRKFVVQKMTDYIGSFDSYTFKGEDRYWEGALKEELEKIKIAIAKLERVRKNEEKKDR